MLRYFLQRLLGLVVVLWAMTVVMFVIVRMIPGDPVAGMMGFGTPRYVIEATREQLGLDRPLPEQYFSYLNDLLHGRLGISIESRNQVAEEMGQRFTASAELILVSMLL